MLDMSKEIDIVNSYLKLTKILSSNANTIQTLLEIDACYVPKQLN